jgi:hypothetical protein
MWPYHHPYLYLAGTVLYFIALNAAPPPGHIPADHRHCQKVPQNRTKKMVTPLHHEHLSVSSHKVKFCANYLSEH